MNNDLFRKKSVDKLESPESLHDYIRVTNPGVWLIMTATIALLVGACLWGVLGRIETTVTAQAVVSGADAYCVISASDCAGIELGMTVRAGENTGAVSAKAVVDGKDARVAVAFEQLPADGEYEAEIVTESIEPFSFVFN